MPPYSPSYRTVSTPVPLARLLYFIFFFFNDTATTEIYTLSLHDALPISAASGGGSTTSISSRGRPWASRSADTTRDRKSTRLNSSHLVISYAVFCLKKKKHKKNDTFALSGTVASSP